MASELADADPATLQEHLKDLDKQRQEVESRLRELDTRRFAGRGRGGPGRVVRLGGSVRSSVSVATDLPESSGKRTRENDEEGGDSKRSAVEDFTSPRNRMDGRLGSAFGSFGGTIAERPKETTTDSAPVKQRNRKLFGALMGHLAKAKTEIQKHAESEQMIKRTEVEIRAEEKEKDDKQKVFEIDRKLHREAREKTFAMRHDLRLKQEEARYLLMMKKREAHLASLQKYIRTKATPPIFYVPGKMDDTTTALLEESAKAVKATYDENTTRLESERAARIAFHESKAQEAAAKEAGEGEDAPEEKEKAEADDAEAEAAMEGDDDVKAGDLDEIMGEQTTDK
eukprot:CAMPEP_0175947436 /NCGR_PEP_ID=MMETSP0108-20121206/27877_1 /TAXON_ID=195067 ORGANISM="Goniomonas pacifica, Strain CCMP1869" /NCGR_SAMPLE_ID=MMETSP0108 /ASSEMBLY_ACC=CAM_ASM_000204 /LENGTH=340 /DNA_ID=CAMNT_0017273051 /DNA_START=19 /DNA_END=1041 /DNA_ORIENTATION=-